MNMSPREILDQALTYEPGQGVVITFANKADCDAARSQLYATMSGEVRASKKTEDPASPEWGTHRWTEISARRIGDKQLRVGRRGEFSVGEVMTLEEAMKGGTDE